MLTALLILQSVALLVLVALLLRKPSAASEADPRLAQLPEQLSKLIAEEARRTREDSATSSAALRSEVVGNISTLGQGLKDDLKTFRDDNSTSADHLRRTVESQIDAMTQRLSASASETNTQHTALREAMNAKLAELMNSNVALQDRLRTTVEERLTKLNEDNSKELEKMRQTVDEKLQATLQTRLTESFGQVTTHLGEVQKGLGEMKELAIGVGDLRKVLSNVGRRGSVGDFLLGQQLEQMFSREQYLKQEKIKHGSAEKVDYALKIPNGDGHSFVLLPIDAKFPTTDWEALDNAYEHGSTEEIASAGKAFERAIRTQAKSICDKYIDPPTTTPYAIMFLATEGLYAEAARRPGLLSDLQNNCRVTIAGPSTFMAILTSFQLGFHTLAIQRKGDEVWNVLSRAKNEFGNFGVLMDKVEKQVGTVQNTLGDIKKKTNTINRSLKDVSSVPLGASAPKALPFEGVIPFAAAAEGDE